MDSDCGFGLVLVNRIVYYVILNPLFVRVRWEREAGEGTREGREEEGKEKAGEGRKGRRVWVRALNCCVLY